MPVYVLDFWKGEQMIRLTFNALDDMLNVASHLVFSPDVREVATSSDGGVSWTKWMN